MSDPNFSNVVLLLYCNGSNGSTTFTDSSSLARTMTRVGDPVISTVQSKWGGASASFPGAGRVTAASSSDFNFGASDFTIECWVYRTSSATSRPIVSRRPGTGYGYCLYLTTGHQLFFEAINSTYGTFVQAYSNTVVPLETWTHVAVTRTASTLKLWVGGVNDQTTVIYASGQNYPSVSQVLAVGSDPNYTGFNFVGYLDDIRISNGIARYSSDFTPPEEEFPGVFVTEGLVEVASPLGAPSAVGGLVYIGAAAAPSPLGAARALALHDFTTVIPAGTPSRWLCDLVTPGGDVRVPISSWQATQQTDRANYAQAVIPACLDYVADLTAATEFVITRAVEVDGLALEYEMVRAPLEQLTVDRGPRRATATIAGYSDPEVVDPNPPAATDRTLTGVRSLSVASGLPRARASIDWLLRPGQRATADGTEITANYINYYVNGSDAYMDVGERA
jgi:hypothetical protein